jgi:N-acetylneuraminate synthase/N,N'-diacetyllegionaminate synthase
MYIASRPIDRSHPPYVIAELGVNHDGSVHRALELVDAAHFAKADAVKLQFFKTDLLMSSAAKLASYQAAAGESDPISMLRRLEFSTQNMAPVVNRAHELGMHAIVTVFSDSLVREAMTLSWDAFKTASPDITHKPLLDALVASGLPLIISTGAANLDEVARAMGWLAPARERTAVLQCVSSYPTGVQHAALAGIADIARLAPGPVGYSDHTSLLETGAMAVAAGACVLEKHLTYDNHAKGPDHAASLTGVNLAIYIRLARQAHAMMGEGKAVQSIEHDVRRVSRQSITTTRPLPVGHVLTAADLTIKRPGTGLEPSRLESTLGRRLARAIEADVPVVEEDLSM